MDFVAARGWSAIIGNHDDAVLQLGTPRMEERYARRDQYGALWWTSERLEPRHRALLEALPSDLVIEVDGAAPIRLVHGVPGNFLLGFAPGVQENWAVRYLAAVPESYVLAGHTHLPMVHRFAHWQVINGGSVGAPFDGIGDASYAVIRQDRNGWNAEIRRVPYALDRVDAGFRDSGLLLDGGVLAELFCRSVLSGQPWVADFTWWMRHQSEERLRDMRSALHYYDSAHGPGRWAFPFAQPANKEGHHG